MTIQHNEQNYKILRQFFYLIFCRFTVSFDNLKNSATAYYQLVSEVEKKVFSHASMIAFLSSEMPEYCRPPS